MNYLHRCSDIACASLFLTCSVSFAQAVLINCQTSACQKKKKKEKSFASLVGRLCYFSSRKFTSSCRNGRRRGANSNSYWLMTDVCSTGWKITPLPRAVMDRVLALSCFLGSSAGHLRLAAVDVTWAFPLTARQWAWTRSLLPVTSLLLLLLPPAFLQQQTAISEGCFFPFLLFSFFVWAELNWCMFLEKNRS